LKKRSLLALLLIFLMLNPSLAQATLNSTTVSFELKDANFDGFADATFKAVNSRGAPIKDVEIKIYLESTDKPIFKGKTDTNGQYVIWTIPPGRYAWKCELTGQSGSFTVSPWSCTLDMQDDFLIMTMLMETTRESTEKTRAFLGYLAQVLDFEKPLPSMDGKISTDNYEIFYSWYPFVDGLEQKLESLKYRIDEDLYTPLKVSIAAIKAGWVYTTRYEVACLGFSGSETVIINKHVFLTLKGQAGLSLLMIIADTIDIFYKPSEVEVTLQSRDTAPEYKEVEVILIKGLKGIRLAATLYKLAATIIQTIGHKTLPKLAGRLAKFAGKVAVFVTVALTVYEIYQLATSYPEYGNIWKFITAPEVLAGIFSIVSGILFTYATLAWISGIGAASWVPYVGLALAFIALGIWIGSWVWERFVKYEENVKKLRSSMSSLLTCLLNAKDALDHVNVKELKRKVYQLERNAEVLGKLAEISPPSVRYNLMGEYYYLKDLSAGYKKFFEEIKSLKESRDLESAIKTCLHWSDGSNTIDAYALGVNSTKVIYGDPEDPTFTCNASIRYTQNLDGFSQDVYDVKMWYVEDGTLQEEKYYGIAIGDQYWSYNEDVHIDDLPYEKDDQGNEFFVTYKIDGVTDSGYPLDFDYVKEVPEGEEGILDAYEKDSECNITKYGWYFQYKYYPTASWSRDWLNKLIFPDKWLKEVESKVEKVRPELEAIVKALEDIKSVSLKNPDFHITATAEKFFYKQQELVDVRIDIEDRRPLVWRTVFPISSATLVVGIGDHYKNTYASETLEVDLENGIGVTYFTWSVPEDAKAGLYRISCEVFASYLIGLPKLHFLDDILLQPILYVYDLNILLPTTSTTTNAGNPSDPNDIYVAVTGIPYVTSFNVEIGGKRATYELVDKFLMRFGVFTLKVTPPTQDNEGKYNLKVTAFFDDLSDSDIESSAVEYTVAPPAEPIERGLAWLRTRQRTDGSWYCKQGTYVGVTSLIATAFLNAGYDENDPTVRKAIQYIVRNVHSDGSIYSQYYRRTYETSLAIIALVATHNETYRNVIENAKDWLINSQWDEHCYWGSVSKDNWYYGGFGYGYNVRPDLSNTQFALLALDAAGLPRDDPTWTKAQVFLHRCQDVDFPITLNVEGEDYVVEPYNVKHNDGGFAYTPTDSRASYGSMTGAGVWGLLLCGVDINDPRAVAAVNWIRNHYTWDENPVGHGNWVLYYYYLSMSKALLMTGLETIDGHDWYNELYNKLVGLQRVINEQQGYWVNTNPSGFEDLPELVTAYAILSLETRAKVPPVQRLSYVTFILRSAAHLNLYDPFRRFVGIDYVTGTVLSDIPTAVYSGPFSEPQYIVIVNPTAGHYTTELVGQAEGTYELTIQGYYGSEQTYSETYADFISPGEVFDSNVVISAIVGPVWLHSSPPTRPVMDVTPKEWVEYEVIPGELISCNITISETSNLADLENVILKPSNLTDEYGHFIYSNYLNFSANNLTVPKGGSRNVTVTLCIPPNAVNGYYTGNIFVTSKNGGNAIILLGIEVLVLHKVSISITPSTYSVVPGGNCTFTVTVTNLGSVKDTYNLTLTFLDFDGRYRAFPTSIQSYWTTLSSTSLAIDPKGSVNATLTITVPEEWAGMEEATYNFTVTAICQADPFINATTSATLTVKATKRSMVEYIKNEIKWLEEAVNNSCIHEGVKNSLLAKLERAKMKISQAKEWINEAREKLANNMLEAAQNILQAFINEIEAQTNKKISLADAQNLIDTSQNIQRDIQKAKNTNINY